MKKKVIFLLVAIFIMANGSFAYAASYVPGSVNGISTAAHVFISSVDAFGATESSSYITYNTFDLTYQYIDLERGGIYSLYESVSGYGTVSTGILKPQGNRYRSYAAYGVHSVTSGSQSWTANTDILY